MQSIKNLMIPLSILLTASILAALIILARASPEQVEIAEPAPPSIITRSVATGSDSARVTTTGLISGRYESQLISQVSGLIQTAAENFRSGATVLANDLLLTIEDSSLRAAASEADAALANARQQLATERGLSDQARREWRDVGNADANSLFLREPQLAAALARHEAAQASRERALLDVERTRVRAPFTGVLADVAVDVGQFVGVGTPIARLISTGDLQLEVSLTARQLAILGWHAQDLSLNPPAAQIEVVQGTTTTRYGARVSFVSQRVEPETQMIPVRLELDAVEGQELPRPGQFVEVTLFSNEAVASAWIPTKSIYQRDQVLLVEEGQLVARPVDLLGTRLDETLVGGLSSGDELVVDRPLWIFPGQQVNPTRAP